MRSPARANVAVAAVQTAQKEWEEAAKAAVEPHTGKKACSKHQEETAQHCCHMDSMSCQKKTYRLRP